MDGQTNLVRVRISQWVNSGWEHFVQDIGMHVLIALIAAVFLSVGSVLVAGPVVAGGALAGLRQSQRGYVKMADFFDGFRYFLPALLASLLVGILTFLGFLLLVIPGLVIMAMYLFTFHFVVDRNQGYGEAMRSSRRLVSGDYLGFTMFLIVLILINFLGAMFLGVGVLVSLPVTWLAITAAYQDLTGQPVPPGPPASALRID
ncbi:MAG: hypothetical protein HY645_14460 [Acidobacteria bacterium]|nr:hypothetical protein [Acidobacteriota bacterium]